jgi:hypothetical protein
MEHPNTDENVDDITETFTVYLNDDSNQFVVNDTYDFTVSDDGTVTAYHYTVLPKSVRGCMTEGEKVSVSFANSEVKVVSNDENGILKVEKGRLRNLIPKASEVVHTKVDANIETEVNQLLQPAPPPPPRTWFRVPGER